MCVYIAIILTILAVTQWHMGRAAALKCNGYKESWQAGHLDKGSVHCRGAWYVNVGDSVHWEDTVWGSVQVYTGGTKFFFNLSLKLTN